MPALKEDDDKLVFVPEAEAIIPPPGLIQHWQDYWWLFHPEKGLLFYDKKRMAPQANRLESVARDILGRLYPWAEVKQISSVFRRIDPRDYV